MKVQERTAELERSNREILERERHLRTLTEAIPQQIWAFDARGSIQYVNQNLKSYLGVENDSIETGELVEAVHPDDRDAFTSAWQNAIAHSESFELEARVRGNGQYRWFLIRGLPRRTHDGGIERWYGINIDIDTQHQAQQSLTVAQEAMSRSARILSMAEMAASIAHELNQPTTALVSHAYACRDWAGMNPPNLDKVRSTAEKIVNESTRASQVVKRVRALFSSRQDVRELVDFNWLVQDSGRLLRDELTRRDVHLRLELAPVIMLIAIDTVQMQQVLVNLSRNAMDAMQSSLERVLTIRTARLKDAIEVNVSDTGAGIPEDQLQRIFEPFYSTKASGTGMGLAICRSIVEAHGGRIGAVNAARGGATIRFTLPMEA
jgi:PAS domain S-box-containing protein